MDKTTKFILGLIAVALIGINVQMWNGKTGLIKPAFSYGDSHSHYCSIGGSAWGSVSGNNVEVWDFGGVSVSCN